MKSLLFLVALFVFCSCSSNKLVKFTPKERDVYTNANLKTFLNKNSNPNIVLRVPNSYELVTTKSDAQIKSKSLLNEKQFDNYYNAIEKELLKGGFSVRDRGLFNEVLSKMQRDSKQNIDYSQINDLTNTDIILEVIKINPAVEYVTNKLQTVNSKGGWKESTGYTEYKKYGATAEFKIILVKNNEMAGTYTFNYAPCQAGCAVSGFNNKAKFKGLKTKGPAIEAYEGVEVNVMEEFIKKCTQDLIGAMKS